MSADVLGCLDLKNERVTVPSHAKLIFKEAAYESTV